MLDYEMVVSVAISANASRHFRMLLVRVESSEIPPLFIKLRLPLGPVASMCEIASLVPRPRPAFCCLQYGKTERAWERGYEMAPLFKKLRLPVKIV